MQELILEQKVLVDGTPTKASLKLRGGEQITVLVTAERPPLRAIAEDIPLDIVYEDDDLAIVNKPAGMMVHAGRRSHRRSAQSWNPGQRAAAPFRSSFRRSAERCGRASFTGWTRRPAA